MTTSPQIAIVVGSLNMKQTVTACLDSLLQQVQPGQAEIILVDASTDGTAALVAHTYPTVRLVRCPPRTLVPHLWLCGLHESTAPLVAFTIAQCVPVPDWLAQLKRAAVPGVAAVGGPIHGPENGRGADWALYFSRYTHWMPPGTAGPIHDLAGDNAAYHRDSLATCQAEMAGGFWETLVNARLQSEGAQLLWVPEMAVTFGKTEPLRHLLRVRWQHGRHFASTRGGGVGTRLLRLLTSPLLVPLLLLRIWQRVQTERPDWMAHFWRAMPVLLLILAAWSLGEATGYALPQRGRTA